MRCEALNCRENENGYCMASSYITITADGECDSIDIPVVESEDEEDARS